MASGTYLVVLCFGWLSFFAGEFAVAATCNAFCFAAFACDFGGGDDFNKCVDDGLDGLDLAWGDDGFLGCLV